MPTRIRLIVIGAVFGLFASLFAATSASAVVATGHAVGYAAPNGLWIGSYRMADGGSGFCVNLGRSAPTGNDFEPVDARTLGWYSADDTARLAYISRTWAGTSDATMAASAQLATWMITGLDGRDPGELAARAGANAAQVLAGANAMIAEANAPSGASHGVTARVAIERDRTGASASTGAGTTDDAGAGATDTVIADLDVDYLAGEAAAAPGSQHGTITLTGATFEDGSAQKQVDNGMRYAIVTTGDDAVAQVTADASFPALPYGDAVTIGRNTGNVQNLLLATAASASASAHAAVERPSLKPFQPTVTTRTSAATASAGASISDALTVGVSAGEGTAATWGVYGPDGGPYKPIPVTVRSSLLGPFDAAPAEADAPPTDAPVVCTVDTLVDNGPGDYKTDSCTLAGPGYYVWVESINAQDTSADSGRARVMPWHSRFGTAAEVSVVPRPVATAPIRYLADTGSALDPRLPALAAAILALGIMLAAAGRARARRAPSPFRPRNRWPSRSDDRPVTAAQAPGSRGVRRRGREV